MDLTIVAMSAMQQDATRLQGIAQNLSNALTPGYKKKIISSSGFAAQFSAAATASVRAGAAMTVASQSLIDPSAGTLRGTGTATDVAIDGDGYFELATPSGPLYTRRGALRVDSSGRLVGPQDFPVMGAGGEIVLDGDAFTISPEGDIVQAGATVARLRVVRFRQAELLEPAGGGSYAQGHAQLDDVAAPARLHIGYQENSNVDSAREMVGLTETVRHFEAMQRLVQGYDELLEKTIRKLGEF